MKNRYVDDEAMFLQGIALSGPRACNELDGTVELGMKTDALRRARPLLRRRKMTSNAFAAAFDAVMIQADRAQRWRRLIESAYARLSKADQHACRPRMLSFSPTSPEDKSQRDSKRSAQGCRIREAALGEPSPLSHLPQRGCIGAATRSGLIGCGCEPRVGR